MRPVRRCDAVRDRTSPRIRSRSRRVSAAPSKISDRTDLEEVRTFANAINQAEQLGTSIARVLKAQSDRLRVRRRQKAEQEARKVPVKMVFPLVFFMMPSLFIFILGPIVLNLASYLAGS